MTGNIDPKLIKSAVESVSKPQIIKNLEWVCKRLDKVENWIRNHEAHCEGFAREHICSVSGAVCEKSND